MALLSQKVGYFDLNTSTGNQAITGVGFTPKLVLLTSAQTVGFGATENNLYSMFSAGVSSSEQWTIGCFGEGGVSATSSDSVRWMLVDRLGYLADATPTGLLRFNLVSMDADGFTINVVTAHAESRRWCYLVLGGEEIQNVKLGTVNITTGTGNQSFTGVGFEPDLMLFAASIPDTALSLEVNSVFALGAATSSTVRACFSNSNNDNTSPTRNDGVLVTTDCIHHTFNDVIAVQAADFVSMDADGFTLNKLGSAPSSWSVAYIAIKGDNLHFAVGTETENTTTGTKATTGVGFMPSVMALFSACRASSASVTAGYRGSVGFTDGTTDLCAQWGFEDNVTTSRAVRNAAQKVIATSNNVAGVIATQSEVELTSFDADGFTLDRTTAADATAREFFYVAIAVQNVILTAGLGEGSGTGFTPLVQPDHFNVTAGLGDGTGEGFAPTLDLGTGINLTAGLGEGSGTGFAPAMASYGTIQDTMVFSEQMRLRDGYLAASFRDRVRGARGDE